MDYKNKIKSFILSNFTHELDDDLDDAEDYFESKFVNSLFAMRLVNFLEQLFDIKIGLDDLSIENFNSINHVMKTVNKIMGTASNDG